MINSYEKELIAAYFQGGNAQGLGSEAIRKILETIKESAKESKESSKDNGFHQFRPPRQGNPAL